jgi:hypothetical protein
MSNIDPNKKILLNASPSPIMGAWITFIPKKQKTSDNTRYEIQEFESNEGGVFL